MAVLSGFTYNGVHSEEFGLYYLPTEEDRWFLDPEYEVYSTDIEWKHGGVYYDSKATIRTFTLNCFFENIDVAKRQAIKAWLKRGTIGMLTFDDMPFVYWIVRPGKIPVGKNLLEGLPADPFAAVVSLRRLVVHENHTQAWISRVIENDYKEHRNQQKQIKVPVTPERFPPAGPLTQGRLGDSFCLHCASPFCIMVFFSGKNIIEFTPLLHNSNCVDKLTDFNH